MWVNVVKVTLFMSTGCWALGNVSIKQTWLCGVQMSLTTLTAKVKKIIFEVVGGRKSHVEEADLRCEPANSIFRKAASYCIIREGTLLPELHAIYAKGQRTKKQVGFRNCLKKQVPGWAATQHIITWKRCPCLGHLYCVLSFPPNHQSQLAWC